MAIGTAYIKIMPEAKGISNAIGGVVDPAAESAGASGGRKWTSAFKKVLAGAAIGKWIGDSVLAGADLEQALGGIETLYKDASGKMMDYASQAYKTAGIDATTYMEQATSFSAALIKSYNGDVDAAADATNTAMIDMADNASKMGTPLESIQNAYQGFAKQNYTMLDNLKLGYGGTKTEMERLLKDAEAITGVHYDISQLGDVYEAIHVIQGELGITGTTAEEASETISGSIGMVKASYHDFISNLALGNDIYPQLEALAVSVGTMLKNVLPAIANVVIGIPQVIIQNFPAIRAGIANAIGQGVAYIQANWGLWVRAVIQIVSNIGTSIIQNMPAIIEKIKTVLTGAIGAIKTAMPGIISAVFTIIKNVGATLVKNLPAILRSALNLAISVIKSLLGLAWSVVKSVVKNIIGTFAGMGGSIVRKIRSGLSTVWDVITSPFKKAKETLDGIVEKIKGFFPIQFGKIFSGLKLPHFNVKGGEFPYGVAGKGSLPSFSIDWYKKAENQPYMFTDATLFGAGERNDEILYGRNQLMKDIAQATGGGDEITINVYGGNLNAQEIAEEVERRLIQAQNRRRLAWQ